MKKFLVFALVLLSVFSVFAEGAKEEKTVYELSAGTSIAAGTSKSASVDIAYIETFKEYIEANSDGRLKMNIFYGNSLGSDADVCAGVANGTIEFYIGDITTTSGYYKPSLLFSIPGAIASMEEASALFASEWGQNFFKECAEQTNIKILGAVSKGFRNFTTVDDPIEKPEDINGLTLRVINNPLFIQMVNSLGGNPVPLDISELYTALQNGIVDGHENAVPNILQDKTYELEKYLVMDAHTGAYLCGMISNSFFESLPADLQKVVLDGGAAATKAAEETAASIITNGLQTLRDNGVTIYEPTAEEIDAWHNAYKDDCMALAKEQIGADVVEDFVKAIEAL